MKRSIACVAALFCFATGYGQLVTVNDFKRLYWLEGTWTRTNAKPGNSGYERWIKISETELGGFGISMKGVDTAFMEKFKLVVKGNSIYYVADVPENKKPVDFKLNEISETGFSCENPGHDFPKKITYSHKENKMTATISGNGKSMDYLFEKK